MSYQCSPRGPRGTLANLVSILTFGFIALTLASCCPDKQAAPPSSVSLREAVLQRQEIRVGYVVTPPSLIKDPNTGVLAGIYYDAVEAMGRNLDLKIRWAEETGWGTMVEGLEAHRYDMIVGGIWPSTIRGKRVVFSHPLYYSALYAYKKSGNGRITNYEQLNDPSVTIATIDGEMSSIIASTNFSAAKTLSHNQDTAGSQLLLDVVSGKADVALLETVYAEEFLANNPDSIESVTTATPLRYFGNTIVIPMDQAGFEHMINTAIDDLHSSGTAEALIKKYERFPGSFLRVSRPFILPR